MKKNKKTDNRKWYEVTITESYHATYKILATDEHEADDIANELVNNGVIDPTNDGGDSYDRETSVEPATPPEDGEEHYSKADIKL